MEDQSILERLRADLKVSGPAAWPEIANATGETVHGLRKLAYGDRKNPSLRTVESLMRYFRTHKDHSSVQTPPAGQEQQTQGLANVR
jgi:hypothetical protein